MGYAGNDKYLTSASWILSALSALLALVPFVYIWKIIKEVLVAAPDFAAAETYLAHQLPDKAGAVAGADQIIVLENEEVKQKGSPAQLNQQSGAYRKMTKLQHQTSFNTV